MNDRMIAGRAFAEKIANMMSPVRCAHCRHVYDLGTVEVTGRYTDCSMWKCPGCDRLVDDRGETGWKSQKDYHRVDKANAYTMDVLGNVWLEDR